MFLETQTIFSFPPHHDTPIGVAVNDAEEGEFVFVSLLSNTIIIAEEEKDATV